MSSDCPRCGTHLPKNGALNGLCPACMLRGLEGPPEVVLTGAGPGRAAPGPKLSEVRRDFPQLEIQSLLGRGGMGLVYRARQPRLDRTVALKILAPDVAGDPAFAERFLREAQALAKLSHPNVVAVHDFGERNGRYYLVMEYVDGTTLRRVLESRRPTRAEVQRIVRDVCAGLHYAHENGIVHRDVKPENVLLDTAGHAKLADFGLVKLADRDDDWRLTRASQVMGTPQYMAPEQMHDPMRVDHRADVYAAGVLLYEMLTGDLPVGRFALPSERSRVDAGFDPIVVRALDQDPARRFPSVRELAEAVDAVSARPETPPGARPEPEPERRGPRPLRVPFYNKDRLEGLVELHGVAWIEGDELLLEYRLRDGFLGAWKSETRTHRLPFGDIAAVEFRRRFRRGELRLTEGNLSTFDGLPEHRYGTFRLLFRYDDLQAGQALAEELARRVSLADA